MEPYRYFLENTETQEWFALNFAFATTSHVHRPIEHKQWTKDPLAAFSMWTKEQAHEHRDKYFNDPKFQVTEHEFI